MKTDVESSFVCYNFKASDVPGSGGNLKDFQIRYKMALVLVGDKKRPEIVFCLDNGEIFRPCYDQMPLSISSSKKDGISVKDLFFGQCIENILKPVLFKSSIPFTVSKVLEKNVPSFKLIESSLSMKSAGSCHDNSQENHFCFLVKGNVYRKK